MKDLGHFVQYDLNDADDCMDLVLMFAFTNQQIKDMKAKGINYHSVNKMLLEEE